MSAIKLDRFGGLVPKVSPHILNDTNATVATNLRVDRGAITPLKGVTQVTTIPNTRRSLTKYNGSWLHWDASNVDAVLSPVPNDTWDRMYFTGDGYPKYTFQGRPSGGSANGFKLGVPKPLNAPTLGKTGTPTGTPVDRYYVFTYVTPQGEEGPPSPVSSVISVTDTETVTVTFTADTLNDYNLGVGSVRRVYRTAQGTSGTVYLYVGEVPIATLTENDTLLDAALGEEIPSTNWFPPPYNMVGLKATPNGFFVGFSGNALCVSERLLPHAWNPNNQLAFPDDITAIAVTGDSIIVLTLGAPYLVTGTSPESLSAIKIDNPQTCSSRASVVNMGGYIMFASPDGLVSATANDFNVATLALLTRDQWQGYTPSSVRAFNYENIYLAFTNTKAFMLDLRGSEAILTDLSGFNFLAGYYDPTDDTLYLLDSAGNIKSWETGAAQSFTWKSKPLRLSVPACPAVVRGFGSGNFTLKLYADGELVATKTIVSGKVDRLPSGYRALEFQVELSGAVTIESFAIAGSVAELS
jgi:hypothetical protein